MFLPGHLPGQNADVRSKHWRGIEGGQRSISHPNIVVYYLIVGVWSGGEVRHVEKDRQREREHVVIDRGNMSRMGFALMSLSARALPQKLSISPVPLCKVL